MLLRLLKSLLRGTAHGGALAADEYPVVRQERMKQAHARAPLDEHLAILYGDLRMCGERLADLVDDCIARSGTRLPPLKTLHRPLASYFLIRYYLHALGLEGARAECGVFQGTSSLILCRAARARDASHDGTGMHLVDSFEGLSAPGTADQFPVPGANGAPARETVPQNGFAGSLEAARSALRDFPGVTFHRGWIPDVFAQLPESRWSFVHVDVDLYEPTYACLDYFYPRLSRGGVIICDDYGSAVFPGASRAWNRYCDERGARYVVLDTGQSVILGP